MPVENILGGMNNGWRLAMATLGFERGPFAVRRGIELRIALDELVRDLTAEGPDGATVPVDPVVRRRLGRCEVLVEALAAQSLRTVDRIMNDGPREESSIDKLLLTEVEQEICALGLDVLGRRATVPEPLPNGADASRWIHAYLYSRSASIYGGSSEIQRGIIAQRVLNLPRT